MSMPSGKLMWGQAGNYDGVDDRLVIRALAAGNAGLDGRGNGVVIPLTFTAGSGLAVTLGPWAAVVSCADGTAAVIGSRVNTTISALAGAAQARTDVLWADITPDGATWTYAIITPAQTANRFGIELGRITVPVNASLASAMTFAPATASFGRWWADTFARPTQQVTSTTGVDVAGLEVGPPNGIPAGKYHLESRLLAVQGTATNSMQNIGLVMEGGTAGQVRIFWESFPRESMANANASNWNGFNQWATFNMGGGNNHVMFSMSGMFNLTAPATRIVVRARAGGSPAQRLDLWAGAYLVVTAVPPVPT